VESWKSAGIVSLKVFSRSQISAELSTAPGKLAAEHKYLFAKSTVHFLFLII
jgi:hypothetical protein